ncbi:MAG: TIR domain-containing protein, partial [Verrucomicrobia bacterium]|nr:TIR domain-containing protein [Verrucomicrobiota bacterium]
MSKPYKYFAFISYSRKDSKTAAWLQKRLEWFRFPIKLVPEEQRPPDPRYVRPIYRDKTNLEVTDEHYWKNIRRALEESRHLIILCSPNSAASEPVNMEVAHFLEAHGGEASLVAPVILNGSVTSAGEEAALCPALRVLGAALINRNLPSMVADIETAEQDAWEAGFVALMSYLLALDRAALGDHIRREERRQLARNRVLTVTFAALALAAVAGGSIAWQQRSAALEAKRDVESANTLILEKSRALEKANTDILDQSRVVEKASAEIVAKNREITTQNQTNLKNLHEASMADYAVAVQRIEKDGKWSEGVAHLARSLKWEAGNMLTATRLYSTLSLYAAEKQTWPREILRHESDARSAQFSADGTRIVTASDDKTARVWDAASGKPLGEPLRHEANVFSAQFSPDGTRIVTASWDNTAKVWDASSGSPLGEPLRHKAIVVSAQFSADGTRIVTASGDNTARVWDVASGKLIGEPLRHEDSVQSAHFSPESTRIVTASSDHTARVWETVSGKL